MPPLAPVRALLHAPRLVVGMFWPVPPRRRPKPEKLEIKDVSEKQADPKALTADQLNALPVPEIDPEQARIEKELVRIAKNDPAMMASLIRTWMSEDNGGNAK